jgi:hypothetical protein
MALSYAIRLPTLAVVFPLSMGALRFSVKAAPLRGRPRFILAAMDR